jgi:hypothetical protein
MNAEKQKQRRDTIPSKPGNIAAARKAITKGVLDYHQQKKGIGNG